MAGVSTAAILQVAGASAYDRSMTAGFDAMRGTDQRFSDALSGADGTWDPAVLMPVLDVYPDALSAPMPSLDAGSIPLVTAVTAGTAADRVVPDGQPAAPAQPLRSLGQASAGRLPASARGPASTQRAARPAPVARPRPAPQPRAPGPAAQTGSPAAIRPAAPSPANAQSALRNISDMIGAWSYQSKITQSDAYWNARQQISGQSVRPASPLRSVPSASSAQRSASSAQRSAPSTQRSAPSQQYSPPSAQRYSPSQPQASTSPDEVAPAAPTVSQYGQMREIRNQSQLRRAARSPREARKSRGQSGLAVLVFIVVVLFATGVGQRILDAINALFQR